MYKLPVWNTIGEAYRFIWAERGAWLNYAAVPFVVIGLLASGYLIFIQNIWGQQLLGGPPLTPEQLALLPDRFHLGSSGAFWVAMAAVIVLYYVVYVTFAVAWHRRLLLGPGATSASEIFMWRKRHWQFVLRAVLAALLAMFVAFVISFVLGLLLAAIAPSSFVLGFIVGIIIGLLTTLALVYVAPAFPAAAVEDFEIGLKRASDLASGNVWRMWAVFVFGLVIPFVIISIGFEIVLATALPPEVWLTSIGLIVLVSVAFQAVNFVGAAVGISLLSIMYRRLRDNVELKKKQMAP